MEGFGWPGFLLCVCDGFQRVSEGVEPAESIAEAADKPAAVNAPLYISAFHNPDTRLDTAVFELRKQGSAPGFMDHRVAFSAS